MKKWITCKHKWERIPGRSDWCSKCGTLRMETYSTTTHPKIRFVYKRPESLLEHPRWPTKRWTKDEKENLKTKCKLCGLPKGEHRAITSQCPLGGIYEKDHSKRKWSCEYFLP